MFTGLDFTTLARVRNVLGFTEADTSRDAEISRLIRSVSADMENEMRRFFKSAAYTETLPMWPPARSIVVAATPVADTPAPIIDASNTRDFVNNAVTLARGVDFVLENETGRIRFLLNLRGVYDPISGHVEGPVYVRVQYTGGAAETQAALETSNPELTEAAELQVSYLFQRQKTPGGNLIVGGNSTNYGDRYHEQGYNWLPAVRRTLEYHKRRSVY